MTSRRTACAFSLFLPLTACATRATLPPPSEPLVATAHRDFPEAPPVPSLMRPIEVPNIHTFTLQNGLHVYVVERSDTNDVELAYIARAGGESGPVETRGLSTLALMALMYMTGDAAGSRARLGEEALTSYMRDDASSLSTSTHADSLDAALRELAAMIATPHLTTDAIEAAVGKQLDELHESVYDQEGLARQHALRMLVGDAHPLGFPIVGKHENVQRFTVGDVESRRQAMFAPETSALVLVGAVTREKAEQLAAQYLGSLSQPKATVPEAPTPLRSTEAMRARALLTVGGVARIVQAFRAPPRQHPDFVPFSLLSILTGELMSSRLFMALREQQERTYAIGSRHDVRRTLSTFVIETDVRGDAVGDTLSGIDGELDRLRTTQVAAHELSRAKLVARERIAGRLEHNDGVLRLLADMIVSSRVLPSDPQRTLNEHIARIDSTTPEDIRQVALTYLESGERGVAVSGPMSDFLPALADWAGEDHIDTFIPRSIADANHLRRSD
jgi:zinc protease